MRIKSDDVIIAALCDAYRHDVERTLALPRKSESGVLPVCVCVCVCVYVCPEHKSCHKWAISGDGGDARDNPGLCMSSCFFVCVQPLLAPCDLACVTVCVCVCVRARLLQIRWGAEDEEE